jgi:hypothetical protein
MAYLLFIIIYLLQSFLLWLVAKKMRTGPAWLAWIPLANDYLISRLAGKHFGWWLLFYVPIVNIYVAYIFWTAIMRRFKKPFWLGIFMLIPYLNWLMLFIIAYIFKYPEDTAVLNPSPTVPPTATASAANDTGISGPDVRINDK